MRALKIAVIVMGIMIVAGVTVIAVTIGRRLAHAPPHPVSPIAARPTTKPFAAAPIEIPPGARIAALAVGAGRIVLGLSLPGGAQHLLVIDLASGAKLGTIELRAAPR